MTAILVASAWAAGCGGSAENSTEFFNQYEATVCEALVTCAEFADVSSCRGSLFFGDEAGAAFDAMVAAGTVEFDSAAADNCLAVAGGLAPCELDFTNGFFRALQAACEPVFQGQVALGAECFYDEECAGVAFCQETACPDACCAGTCVADEPVPPLVQVGQPCNDFVSCESGAYCNIDFATGAGVCTFPAAEGQTCNANDIIPCDRTYLFCDPAASTCQRLPDVGEPCDAAAPDSCVDYAVCNGGTCQALPGAGQTCDPGAGCLGELECVNGACAIPELDPICR